MSVLHQLIGLSRDLWVIYIMKTNAQLIDDVYNPQVHTSQAIRRPPTYLSIVNNFGSWD